MRMRLIGFSCALALIALALVPMLPPSRALTNAPEKIDPALQTMMTARPLALLPVIVEMQPPTASVGNVDRANQALDLLRLNGAAAVGLPLLGSAAGFANAAGIDAMSLVPTVAYIHYDATVVPDVVVPDAASDRALDPPPTPLPSISPLATPTPTPTPAPPDPTPLPTPTPTAAPTATTPPPTPTPTPTPTPSPDPTPLPTASPTPAPTATPAPTDTPMPVAPTAAPAATAPPSPAPDPTPTPTTSASPSPVATPSSAPAPSPTPTASPTPTPTPTASPLTQGTTVYPQSVNADQVVASGTTGRGVTVAVLDSGVAADPDLTQPSNRILASVNFADTRATSDPGGHGTHVAGIVAGNGTRSGGQFVGIAPQANIVDVRVLGRTGSGRISSVVAGIQWVIGHRAAYNIRVINMSFGAPVTVSYRTDPLSAAVEIAWREGLVVVAAAGNGGPTRNSVLSPGIDPYAVTVGATDDQGTTSPRDDALAVFSSWGNADSNAKPDLVAPGRHIVSLRVPGSALDSMLPTSVVAARNGATYFRLSGTSMATPVVSGAVALLLQRQPSLTPDQVKALLVGTAQQFGQDSTATLPDPTARGAGLLDALAAVSSSGFSATTSGGALPTAPLSEPAIANRGHRPADGFARTLLPVLRQLPLRWKDLTLDGIAWQTLTWDSVAWDSVAWDNFDWDSIAWDSIAWDSVAWDSIAWDSIAWDSVAWDSIAWDSIAWDASSHD